MNRKERRVRQKISREYAAERPMTLTLVPEADWPSTDPRPKQVWASRKYLVQLYTMPEMLRLSISRVTLNTSGRWNDGLTWDELQAIKREVGFGDWYAVEVYPRDRDIVNVSNMRHLWLLPSPLPIGWFGE